jgi:hypothetical protein
MHIKFSRCASKELRENLVKEELRNRFPLIGNRTIYVEEYLGKMYNEYKYEINVECVSLFGKIHELQVRNFSEIPKDLLDNLDKMGIDTSSILNEYEGKYFNFIFKIDPQNFNLVGKKIGFLGSKLAFFKDERDWYCRGYENGVGSTTLYILNAEEKIESGGYDAAIVYWSKFVIPIEKVIEKLKNK